MANIVQLNDRVGGEKSYPVTIGEAVLMDDAGTKLPAVIDTLQKKVLQSKTFTGIIGSTSNSATYCNFYLMKVRPSSWYANWHIRFRVRAFVTDTSLANAPLCSGVYILDYWGKRDTYSGYQIWNAQNNTSYRPIYYHRVSFLNETGYNAGYAHYIGEDLTSAYNRTTAAWARTIIVDILEADECEVTFLDSAKVVGSIPEMSSTNYASIASSFNATTQGLQETGDDNTTTTLARSAFRFTVGDDVRLNGYCLFGFSPDGKVQSFGAYGTSASTTIRTVTNGDRLVNPNGIDWRLGIWRNISSSNFDVGASSSTTVYVALSDADLRYTFNCVAATSTTHNELGLLPAKFIYLRGYLRDGLFFFAPLTVTYNNAQYLRPWTQDVPTEEEFVTIDGVQYPVVYWLLGEPSYSSSYTANGYTFNLLPYNPLFIFRNGRFELYCDLPEVRDCCSVDNDGNATFPAQVVAASFKKSGGTAAQFLKADGSVDATAYYHAGNAPSFDVISGTISNTQLNEAITALPAWTAAPVDNCYLIRQDTGRSNQYGRIPFSALFSYIKSKLTNYDNLVSGPASVSNNAIAVFDGTTGKLIKAGGKSLTELDNAIADLQLAITPDTLNTVGATDTASKIFLVGVKAQGANPQSYSQDTAYVGTDGCLYSGGVKVLTAHQSLSAYAKLASPALTGTPTAPTAAAGTNSTQIATTAFVKTAVGNAGDVKGPSSVSNNAIAVFDGTTGKLIKAGGKTLTELDNAIANLELAITPDTLNTVGATDTASKIFLVGVKAQGANPQSYSQDTAYVGTDGCLYSGGAKVLTAHQSLAAYATLASPALTGTPTAPTAAAGTNSTQIATTAFVKAAVEAASAGASVPDNIVTTDATAFPTGSVALWSATARKLTTCGSFGNSTSPIYLEDGIPKVCAYTDTVAATNNTGKKLYLVGATAQSRGMTGYSNIKCYVGSDNCLYSNSLKVATLSSPALTGTPTAPTPAADCNNTQLATTAFVHTAVGSVRKLFLCDYLYGLTNGATINTTTWGYDLTGDDGLLAHVAAGTAVLKKSTTQTFDSSRTVLMDVNVGFHSGALALYYDEMNGNQVFRYHCDIRYVSGAFKVYKTKYSFTVSFASY